MVRVGIIGAPGLLAKELNNALEERKFPTLSPRLLTMDAVGPALLGIVAFGDEAAVIEPFSADMLAEFDVLFLSGSAADAHRVAELARVAHPCPLLVDLAGALDHEPGARLAGFEAEPGDGGGARLLVVAHPAAQMLALLLERLERCGRIEVAAATVFEPASQRGMAGIQELEQQTVKLLALQALPQAVFDGQVAFNLRMSLGEGAVPSLASVRERILADTRTLCGQAAGRLALQVLQPPLFHGSVVSLFVGWVSAPPAAAVQTALESPWLRRVESPDVVSVAGEDTVQVSGPRMDAGHGMWLYAGTDNLRRIAFSAVDAAAAALARRPA